jgi:hypothetical protein
MAMLGDFAQRYWDATHPLERTKIGATAASKIFFKTNAGWLWLTLLRIFSNYDDYGLKSSQKRTMKRSGGTGHGRYHYWNNRAGAKRSEQAQ